MALTRKHLELLESKGQKFYGTLEHIGGAKGTGVYWIDWENNSYYTFITDDKRLTSKNLTDEQINDMVIYNIREH